MAGIQVLQTETAGQFLYKWTGEQFQLSSPVVTDNGMKTARRRGPAYPNYITDNNNTKLYTIINADNYFLNHWDCEGMRWTSRLCSIHWRGSTVRRRLCGCWVTFGPKRKKQTSELLSFFFNTNVADWALWFIFITANNPIKHILSVIVLTQKTWMHSLLKLINFFSPPNWKHGSCDHIQPFFYFREKYPSRWKLITSLIK